MSDVGISGGGAPSAPASAPSAPSRGGGEAVINPSPVNIPSPSSNQVTDPSPRSPEGVEAFKGSRRDTIAKAFERARTDPVPANRPKPSIGHNQPPEPTPKEAVNKSKETLALPKLDLKKRPVAEEAQPRARGEHGHFAAQTPPAAPGQPQPGLSRPDQAAPVPNPLPQHAPYREPLARMDPKAKAEWHQAPESVRASMHRMYREFDTAAKQMRGAWEAMKTIAPYHRMAQEHGTTLDRALNNYVSMENKLRSDPIGGLDVIINNLNLRTEDGQRLGLRDIAWHVLNQTPEQHQLLQSQNTQTAMAYQMQEIQRQQQALAHAQQQMHYERQFVHTRGQVDRFAETHPRLDELGPAIEQELRLGFSLDQAYARADRLYPATHAAQTRTASLSNAPAQTRIGDRSISGAPDSSLNGGPRRTQRSATPRDAVARAMRANGI